METLALWSAGRVLVLLLVAGGCTAVGLALAAGIAESEGEGWKARGVAGVACLPLAAAFAVAVAWLVA